MPTSKLLRNYNTQEGVNEFSSAIQASIEFRDAMKRTTGFLGQDMAQRLSLVIAKEL